MSFLTAAISRLFSPPRPSAPITRFSLSGESQLLPGEVIGVIAGNGPFPRLFSEAAKRRGHEVVAVCHSGETDPEIENVVREAIWVKVGELGRTISSFSRAGIRHAVMAGGINRIRHFGGIKLDLRGAALLARLRSTKDDVIMRGIADELARDGIEVISCATFMEAHLAAEGVMTRGQPSEGEHADIRTGIDALRAMSSQDIGQLVVVREGVIVAVEAVEGSDAAIRRGGELGGKGVVVVKFSKPTQDLRFDIPMIGVRTIEVMAKARARVLAVEAGCCLMLDLSELLALAEREHICVVGCPPLDRV